MWPHVVNMTNIQQINQMATPGQKMHGPEDAGAPEMGACSKEKSSGTYRYVTNYIYCKNCIRNVTRHRRIVSAFQE